MRRHLQGFTLIETLWALAIGILVFFTVALTAQQLTRDFERPLQVREQLDNALIHLTSPTSQFKYLSGDKHTVELAGNDRSGRRHEYVLAEKHGQLLLTTLNGGYMPLAELVSQVKFNYEKNSQCLSLLVTFARGPKHPQGQQVTGVISLPMEDTHGK
ncbi:hypothetical protein [Furfurilactobacillus curtus]|uniref:Prepilin-type N-terminal cleavage/methylation domain-containing protein n=1 Tax=Furfurilactobacillus curtus TaxID=1746200 RepID=A0ABQ5JTI0_9LACO